MKDLIKRFHLPRESNTKFQIGRPGAQDRSWVKHCPLCVDLYKNTDTHTDKEDGGGGKERKLYGNQPNEPIHTKKLIAQFKAEAYFLGKNKNKLRFNNHRKINAQIPASLITDQ